ncbi:MAG TPA: apolipoprotein N-acyltransferase, partial [Burkholderiaceae bacterium]|nr:apolipoprotein N-acyltransferase [Burkholderiaceae bacterium]
MSKRDPGTIRLGRARTTPGRQGPPWGIERREVPRIPHWAGMMFAFGAGIAHALSFAPLELWWLQVVATGALVVLLAHARAPVAARRGWAFGFGWLAAGLWWIFISLHRYGGLSEFLSTLAVGLLAALLALYYAAAAALWASLRRRSVAWDAALFAACWLLAELARGRFLTGFPWIAGGYAHTSGPFAAWAPWIGVYGIGALAAWTAASIGLGLMGLRNGRWGFLRSLGPLLVPLALLAGGELLPATFTRSTGMLTVSLLQTDVPQDVKFDDAHIAEALRWHLAEFNAAPGQLVVTPESSIPVLADQVPPQQWLDLQRPFDAPGRGALVGMFLGDDEHGY